MQTTRLTQVLPKLVYDHAISCGGDRNPTVADATDAVSAAAKGTADVLITAAASPPSSFHSNWSMSHVGSGPPSNGLNNAAIRFNCLSCLFLCSLLLLVLSVPNPGGPRQ